MKVKQSIPSTSVKSMKLLSYYRNSSVTSDFIEMDNSVDSIGSGIKIISGNLEDLKPLGYSKEAVSASSTSKVLPSSFNSAQKLEPSTSRVLLSSPVGFAEPKYEDISDVEEECKSDDQAGFTDNTVSNNISESEDVISTKSETMDTGFTFNLEEDQLQEKQEFENYMYQVASLASVSQQMVRRKREKRGKLLKQLKIYEKKYKDIFTAIKNLDKLINFVNKIPNIIRNY